MSEGDESKTREQLLAEIEALKKELERLGGPPAIDDDQEGSPASVLSTPITRRDSLVGWVAPVILSLPVAQGVGMALASGTAHADPLAPTMAGRCIPAPTSPPTGSPTAPATAKPTATPTVKASVAPTPKPKKGAPTMAPTVAPVLGMAAAPDADQSLVLFIALGSARTICSGFVSR